MFQRYSDQFLRCLGTYQFIEEGLRFCLIRCHATTHFRLDGFLPYHIPKGLTEAALGRLIDWYSVYTENDNLIRELRKIKQSRDYFAHRGLALTVEESSDELFMSDLLRNLEQAQLSADKCFGELVKEMETVDDAVNRAYEVLKADRARNNREPPKTFEDEEPKLDGAEP